ncbi:MAG: VOC family protein, partial [Myxococcota bacterium]
MLTRMDRLQVAASDRRDAVECYQRLLDAAVVREDRVKALAAERTVLRVGRSEIEVLEPDGVGRVADFLGRCGEGLFAAGFTTGDLQALAGHLRRQGRPVVEEGGQLVLSSTALGLPGLSAVVGPEEEREAIGLLRGLYEVT